MAKAKQNQLQRRMRDYLLAHIASASLDFSNLVLDLQENRIHPDRNPKPEKRIPFLQKLSDEQLAYIEQAIKDLHRFEKSRGVG